MADPKPTYRKADLEKVIDRGGSVLYNGEIITDKSKLPSGGKEKIESFNVADLSPARTTRPAPPNADNTSSNTSEDEDGSTDNDGA